MKGKYCFQMAFVLFVIIQLFYTIYQIKQIMKQGENLRQKDMIGEDSNTEKDEHDQTKKKKGQTNSLKKIKRDQNDQREKIKKNKQKTRANNTKQGRPQKSKQYMKNYWIIYNQVWSVLSMNYIYKALESKYPKESLKNKGFWCFQNKNQRLFCKHYHRIPQNLVLRLENYVKKYKLSSQTQKIINKFLQKSLSSAPQAIMDEILGLILDILETYQKLEPKNRNNHYLLVQTLLINHGVRFSNLNISMATQQIIGTFEFVPQQQNMTLFRNQLLFDLVELVISLLERRQPTNSDTIFEFAKSKK